MIAQTFKAAALASIVSTPLAAQSFNWSDLNIHLPQSDAPTLCDAQPSDTAFNAFHCPLMAEAMWYGDPSLLKGYNRGEQFAYISAWVNGVHEPSIVWKVDPSVYSSIAPRLPMHVRHLMASNPDVIGNIAGESIGIMQNFFKGFVDARRNAVNNNALDPMGELSGMLGGMAAAPKPITLTAEIAQHDVMAWIGLAQRDPDAAVQLYDGMRTIATNF